MRSCECSSDETEQRSDSDPKIIYINQNCPDIDHAARATHSKMFEYSSFLAAESWMTMSRQPRGKATTESMNEPLKLTLQIDAEQKPPMMINCQFLYRGFLIISSSRAMEASLTDILSWVTLTQDTSVNPHHACTLEEWKRVHSNKAYALLATCPDPARSPDG